MSTDEAVVVSIACKTTKAHGIALCKTLQDFGIYLNTFLQMLMRWDSETFPKPPWLSLGFDSSYEIGNTIYFCCGIILSVILAIETQRTFTRTILRDFYKDPHTSSIENTKDYPSLQKIAAGYKSVVKITSIGLQVLLYMRSNHAADTHSVPFDADSPSFIVAVIVMVLLSGGVFLSEFVRLRNGTAGCDSEGSQYTWIIFFKLWYCALCSGLGSGFTYLTSGLGYLNHIHVSPDQSIKNFVVCYSYLFSFMLTLSETAIAHVNLSKYMFNCHGIIYPEKIKIRTCKNTILHFITILAAKGKSVISSSSFSAMFYTILTMAGATHDVSLYVSLAIFSLFSISGYYSQFTGLNLPPDTLESPGITGFLASQLKSCCSIFCKPCHSWASSQRVVRF